QKPRKPKRKDTQIPESSGPTKHVADEAVYKELDNSLVRAATTSSSLEAEQDSGNIIKTRSMATPNEVGSQGTTSGGGPRRQETMGDTIAQTRFENVFKLSNDLLLSRGEEVNAINADTDITLVNVQDDADNEMFDVDALNGEQVWINNNNNFFKGLSQDKGKGILVEPEKPLKKKDQLKLDEEIALKLQAKIDEEERITRAEEEKIDEANIAWDDIQAKVDVDYQLAKRLTELVEGSSKRAGEELEQDSIKKQKVDEDKDTIELQSLMEVIPDEEELVKAKYGSTRQVEDLDLVLWNDLKTMFEPHVEDKIWKLQQRYKVLSWKLFDSYGVHCLSLQYGMIYMLVEKRYPLTPPTITNMLNKKLQVDYFSEMAYQLLKLLTKQLKNQ
ncbi:hypothetical protein Tco_0813187, partial [Tanacetum coccineum]